jgi:serine/threonine protein kinase
MRPVCLIGQRIAGRYRLRARIGGGRASALYLGWDQVAQRDVVVKVRRLSSRLDEHDALAARLQQRIAAMSARPHPAIVRVLDGGAQLDLLWLVTELVEGEPLDAVLAPSRPLSGIWSTVVVTKICRALDVARQQGITHLRVEPDEFMITMPDPGTGEPEVKVLATSLDGLSTESPEDPLADAHGEIWAIGRLLYRMLAGWEPGPGESFPPLRHVVPGTNTHLEEVVAWSLDRHPRSRPKTTKALAEALTLVHRVLERDATHAPNPGPLEIDDDPTPCTFREPTTLPRTPIPARPTHTDSSRPVHPPSERGLGHIKIVDPRPWQIETILAIGIVIALACVSWAMFF